MDSIRAIGFDMDYTLVRYMRAGMEELAFRLTLNKLVERGYPAAIKDFKYDNGLVIRGLSVDKQLGNILKLDRHSHPGRVYHGRTLLSQQERRDLYRREMLRFVPPRFALIDTLFSMPEMSIYANLVEFFDTHERHQKNYVKLFDDTRASIDEIHRDNTLKSAISANLSQYIDPDPLLARTLHKLRSSGKKLFLLTNSMWEYTDAVMRYLLRGQMAEYSAWQGYFEAVLVGAQKPTFFTGRAPLVQLDPNGAPIERTVTRIEKGMVYQGGNLQDFQRAMNVFGEEVLYVGDHIYGDILRSKKTSLWRTALVIEELEEEILMTDAHRDELSQLDTYERERQRLDNELNVQRQNLALTEKKLGASARDNAEFEHLRAQRELTRAALKDTLTKISELEATLSRFFNPIWGMVFKEERENSRFGEQVTSYACIYMSRVTNFHNYSSFQYFRSPRDLMPHERR